MQIQYGTWVHIIFVDKISRSDCNVFLSCNLVLENCIICMGNLINKRLRPIKVIQEDWLFVIETIEFCYVVIILHCRKAHNVLTLFMRCVGSIKSSNAANDIGFPCI